MGDVFFDLGRLCVLGRVGRMVCAFKEGWWFMGGKWKDVFFGFKGLCVVGWIGELCGFREGGDG